MATIQAAAGIAIADPVRPREAIGKSSADHAPRSPNSWSRSRRRSSRPRCTRLRTVSTFESVRRAISRGESPSA